MRCHPRASLRGRPSLESDLVDKDPRGGTDPVQCDDTWFGPTLSKPRMVWLVSALNPSAMTNANQPTLPEGTLVTDVWTTPLMST